ncbi:nicotinamide mononucleotide transporter [Mangrovimonas yunxiaonensis]|uniref:Nicotinamide riboside transporter PnuC n=1 Tax=Mangrovimonas yunxiaonensis TaxID=1197477 RepID=A0A084TLD0_9FLAO|nr:nicotinamide riboside transporter PnuC [Mangrovimonas yunxiaonensis]KFB01516.1 nicotinamide mononucleotide transporter [Mangrovimonas yunxiaonensis]GGH36228.1 nicotinamide mononucleotide transporter [Mangrovimonas yunxiaonensis]
MSPIFDWLFAQYQGVDTHLIVLEFLGVFFGFLSVWYSKQENILVYPTGIISTAIFVYILWVYGLLGDMFINAYYFSMSIYGWYYWTRKGADNTQVPVTKTTKKEHLWSVVIFVLTLLFVIAVYKVNNKFNAWTAYVDTVTTAIFFVGMWLMAKKKLENWTYWIIGDLISVPLYFYKGLIFTSFQYFLFTIIAIYGFRAWKNSLNNNPQTA